MSDFHTLECNIYFMTSRHIKNAYTKYTRVYTGCFRMRRANECRERGETVPRFFSHMIVINHEGHNHIYRCHY